MADISQVILLDGNTYNLKDAVARKGQYYGVCDTAAATVAKTVTIEGITELEVGLCINIKFTEANTVSAPTLNVNGLGAKNIRLYGTTNAAGATSTTGWYAGAVVQLTYDGSGWVRDQGFNTNTTYTLTEVFCGTAASTAAKASSNSTYYVLREGNVFEITFRYSNTAASALTLNIASTGAKPIYINGVASSASNHTLPAGKYIVYYDGAAYQIRTDGKLPVDIAGNAETVNEHTVNSDVPANAKFTDTTYSIANDMSNGLVPKTFNGTYSDVHFLMDDTTNHVAAWGVPPNATQAKSGYMSSADKTKLDGMKTVVVSTSAPTETYASVWVDTDEEGDRIIPEMMIHKSATLTASNMPFTISDSRISSIMRVCNTVFGTPAYVRSDISWTTGDGYVTFTGTISGSTSIDFDLIEAQT